MTIYVFLILLILCGTANSVKSGSRRNLYINAVFVAMVLIVGLRDISVGKVDTEMIYTPRITQYFGYSFAQIIAFQTKDTTFYILTKILSNIKANINFVLFVIGIPYIAAVTRLVKKYSEIPWLSFILFLGLSYFTMSFFLLRQVVAMSLTILAFDAIVDRRPIKFIILVLLGSLFHQSCLIFLLAYPVARLRIGVKQWVAVAGAFVLSLAMRPSFMTSLLNLLDTILSDASRYNAYETIESGLGYTGFLIQLVVLVGITYLYRRKNDSSPGRISLSGMKITIRRRNNIEFSEAFDGQIKIMYNLFAVSIMVMAFSAILGEMWRVASYFGIFGIILLPNAISTIRSAEFKMQVIVLVTIVFILYFLFIQLDNAMATNYSFFWTN